MKRIISTIMLIALIAGGMTVRKTSAGDSAPVTLVIDLSQGAAVIALENDNYGEEVAFLCKSLGYAAEIDGMNCKMDVDGDGTMDVACTYWNPYNYPVSKYYVFTPLPGWSLTGDVTVTSSRDKVQKAYEGTYYLLPSEDSRISTVVIKTGDLKEIKKEYRINTTQGKACRYVLDDNGETKIEVVTSAAPGERLFFSIDLPKGQYLKNLKSEFFDMGKVFAEWPEYWPFVMPAADITLTPVIEKQKAETFKYTEYGSIYSEGSLNNAGNCVMESMFNETWYKRDAGVYEGFFDIDGDGTDDVFIGPAYAGMQACPCKLRSVNTYVTKGRNDGPFWPVTVDFGDGQYVIDEWPDYNTSGKNGELLRKNLAPYAMADNASQYDLDRDGSADFSVENGFLSTCSLGNDPVTIPAVKGGINHDITFVRTAMQGNVYSITLTGENADKAVIGSVSGTKKPGGGFLAEEMYMIIPEDGFEVYSAFSNQVDVTRGYGAEYYSFTLPYYDVTIQVEIREKGAVTPTPTPTPTAVPTATPVPTEEPTAAPTETPEESEEKADAVEEDAKQITQKDAPLNPLFWIIPLCVVLLTAAVLAVCAVKRKKS